MTEPRTIRVTLTGEEVAQLILAIDEYSLGLADNEGFDSEIATLEGAEKKLRRARAAAAERERTR